MKSIFAGSRKESRNEYAANPSLSRGGPLRTIGSTAPLTTGQLRAAD
ncbi:MAG: hypothetical protein ACK5CW_02400 [Verrucomicrobiota bacterium]